jgi:hypothetical protein
MRLFSYQRVWAGISLLLLAELLLWSAIDGPHKVNWILAISVPNLLLTVGFIVKPRDDSIIAARGR